MFAPTEGYLMERIEKIRNELQQVLSEKTFVHSLAVCETAVELAERFGADKEKAYLAALLHDCAKEVDIELYCEQNGVKIDDYIRKFMAIAHAPAGANMARQHFGIDDEDVISAIAKHTGYCQDGESMSLLDKIVCLADAIEPKRKGSNVDEARIAAIHDLDEALVLAGRR